MLGSRQSTPIPIDEDPADFADFLWVFYNQRYGIHKATPDQWITILRLATIWGFPSVRKLAISHLKTTSMDVMEKIKAFQEYKVPRSDMLPAFVELASRENPLSREEFGVLEDDTKFCITQARETLLRTALSVERDAPAMDHSEHLNVTERSRLVAEVFGLPPPETPASEVDPGESSSSSSTNSSLPVPDGQGGEDLQDDAVGPAESSEARRTRVPVHVRSSSDDLHHARHIVRRRKGRLSLNLSEGGFGSILRRNLLLPYCLAISFMCVLIA